MSEYAGMLPRKFISFHCLENKSNEPQESNSEGTENFPDLPQRSESDVECRVGGESPENRLTDLEVVLVVKSVRSQPKESMYPTCPMLLRAFKKLVMMKVRLS